MGEATLLFHQVLALQPLKPDGTAQLSQEALVGVNWMGKHRRCANQEHTLGFL